jgi:hypothetical protein
MTRMVSSTLPAWLLERLSQQDLQRRLGVGLPFVTRDARGRPHPMLVSYLELRAYDSRTLGLVIRGESASARNLAGRGTGTLMIVEPDLIAYVMTHLLDGPLPIDGGNSFGLVYFLLEVEEVRDDSPADWEAGTRIVGPIRYEPAPTLDEPWARLTLAALSSPRARA